MTRRSGTSNHVNARRRRLPYCFEPNASPGRLKARMAIRTAALLIVSVLAAGTFSSAAEDRPRLEPRRTTTPPTIDGRLDDAAWQDATLPLTEWLTYNPLNGERLAQTTEVRAAYDDRYLYF